jgi:hypothetical protein
MATTTFLKINELGLVTEVTGSQEIVIYDTDTLETLRLNTILLRSFVANTSMEALNVANLSLVIANTANTVAKNANNVITNALITTNNALTIVNTINVIATSANSTANSAKTIAISAFNTVNIAINSANGIFANLAMTTANNANTKANLSLELSILSYNTANSANATANLALTIGTNAYNRANTANATANLALITGTNAYNTANTANAMANFANSWTSSSFTGPIYGGFVPKNATINYGIKSTSDNTVSIFTSDQNKLHIDSSGNVGIGYTSTAYKLAVDGNGYFSNSIFSNYILVNPQTTNYSLETTDSGKLITMDSGSNLLVTINSVKNFPIGFRCIVMRLGTGSVSIGNTGSSYWKSRSGANSILDQYGSASIIHVSTNQFIIDGDI